MLPGTLMMIPSSLMDERRTGLVSGEPPVRWVRVDRLRLVTPEELAGFAEAAGLEVETLAGDYDLGPLDGAAERVVMVARAPSATR